MLATDTSYTSCLSTCLTPTVASFIGQTVTIHIDRALGSRHPTHGFVYPINYGYLPTVMAPDGEELDAYLLGVFEPVEQFEGQTEKLTQQATTTALTP